MLRFRVTKDTLLDNPIDSEARLARIPASYVMKGMFFSRLVERIEGRWADVSPGLREPPRNGRYLAFGDYPQSDYARLIAWAGPYLFPGLPLSESQRRLARTDVDAFASTTVGGVMLSLIGDPAAALLRLPDIYRLVMKGGEASASREGGGVRLRYRNFHGSLDGYGVGNVEGLVMHYGQSPDVEAELVSDTEGSFLVRW